MMANDLGERTTGSLEDGRDQLGWLRSGLGLIAATVALAVLAALVYSLVADKRYEAHARVLVTPLPADNTDFLGVSGLLHDSTQGDPVVAAAQILDSDQIRTAAEAAGPGSGATFAVKPLQQGNTVDISATASDADSAAAAANAYLDTALRLRSTTIHEEATASMSRLRARLDKLAQSGLSADEAPIAGSLRARLGQLAALLDSPDPTLSTLDRATPPDSAAWPRTTLGVLIAACCGLLLGIGLAWLRARTSSVVDDAGELGAAGVPVVAHVPYVPDRALRWFRVENPPSVLREGYRRLRGVLAPPPEGRHSEVVAVCSASQDESRTGTAIGLARAFADAERRVILVDGDMRRSTATLAFGAVGWGALPTVLRNPKELDLSLVALEPPNLSLLAAGHDADAASLLASDRLGQTLAKLRERADVVVVDTPPVGETADALDLASCADRVLVCAVPGRTERDALRQTVAQLDRLAAGRVALVAVDRKDGNRANGFRFVRDLAAQLLRHLETGSHPRPRIARDDPDAAAAATAAAEPQGSLREPGG